MMSKHLSSKTSTVLVFVLVFIVPNLFFQYISSSDKDKYFERADEDQEICLERAERDSVETRWCNEIKSASKLAYDAADNSFEIGLLMNLFLPVLYGLVITVRDLRKKIEELTEKLNA